MNPLRSKLVTAAAICGGAIGGGAIANAATSNSTATTPAQGSAATQQARPSFPAHGTAAHEALAFWNDTLAELQLRPRFLDDKVLVDPPITRSLENYTRQIWLLAGRPLPYEGAVSR